MPCNFFLKLFLQKVEVVFRLKVNSNNISMGESNYIPQKIILNVSSFNISACI